MISILDYGMGNLGSLENMVRRLGEEAVLVSKSDQVFESKKLILPGVGSFDNAMRKLHKLGWIDLLRHKVIEEKIPILCICLGMQLITKSSEEGSLPGLGWINARTIRFQSASADLKIPHMGWNYVFQEKRSRLFENMYEEPRYYFVHSYYVECEDESNVLATTRYGINFASVIEHDNIYATQFHPEKSHKYGMKLIQNFMEI